MLQVAVCEQEGREGRRGDGGRLGHGDLHGLQHLLHRLHGAFVLLGPAAGQLHVREGKREADRHRVGQAERKRGGEKRTSAH